MASFATIKSLADEKKFKSSYQILSEFIRHIITEEHLFSFDATIMKNLLAQYFDFSVPEAVIKTAAKGMAGISSQKGIFTVSPTKIGTDSLFKEKKKEVDSTNDIIIAALSEYIQNRTEKKVDTVALTEDLIGFLVEDQHTANQYTELIGEFILKNESNQDIQKGLDRIREGSILYLGLNYNLDETGSITKPLTLYLGTEILFSLVGYNGEIYKQLAEDFFHLVQKANSGGIKKIQLRYFADVKREIDDFFYSAESIVEGRKHSINDTPAMIAITNGCVTASDVLVRRADFDHNIQFGFGIQEDPNNDYYNDALHEFNLESAEAISDDDKAKKRELGLKFASHINKLRKGKISHSEIDSEYLFITNTKAMLIVSTEQVEELKYKNGVEYIPSFSVSLDKITSLLWYKLGYGFGNSSFPKSVSAVLQARIVLSTCIAREADKAYSDIKNQYDDGKISEEQLAARIIMLRGKPMLPEELQGDDIENIMDFSQEYICRFEEQVKSDRKASEEKDRIIDDLRNEKSQVEAEKNATIQKQEGIIQEKEKALSEREATIQAQNQSIKSTEARNAQLTSELDKYRKEEERVRKKKENQKNILRFAGKALLKLCVAVLIGVLVYNILQRVKPEAATTIGFVVSILGFVATEVPALRKDIKKYFPKDD